MKRLLTALLAIVPLLMGLAICVTGITHSTQVEDLSGFSMDTLEVDTEYHAQITVWSHFYYDSDTDQVFFKATTMLQDRESTVVLAVDADKEEAWAQLEDLEPGHPLTLDCVVEAEPLLLSDPYYDEVQLALISPDPQTPVLRTHVLVYYSEDVAYAQGILIAGKAVFIVVGLFLILLSIRMLLPRSDRKPVPGPTASMTPEARKRLESYKTLLEEGLITKEEYELKRKQLLSSNQHPIR